eukprot:TRINITY_DN59824_c0_g1_i1.p1 TRINITY_DN59824_c0_g1~~TRINITY_DN59824_c0_g1_i1.p1  ORF type:complete len:399 (+),score=55.27 TRINITY_DN59824_c0_g1_i1:43-1239(+)
MSGNVPKRGAGSPTASGESSPPAKRTKKDVLGKAELELVVSELFLKVQKGSRMKAVEKDGSMKLTAEVGIDDNAGTQRLSPRQVLMVGTGDLAKNSLQAGELRENILLDWRPTEYGKAKLAQRGKLVPNCTSGGVLLRDFVSSGDVVRIGETCELRVTMFCEPCGHVIDYMKNFRGSEGGTSILSAAADRVKSLVGKNNKEKGKDADLPTVKSLDGHRGMLATCMRGGVIRRGDAVRRVNEETSAYEPLPELAKDKVKWILATKVPAGKVVPIRDLLQYIGEPAGYARALPAVLRSIAKASSSSTAASSKSKKASSEAEHELPLHRVVDSERRLMTHCIEDQAKRLEGEGIQLTEDKKSKSGWRVPESFVWEPKHRDLYWQITKATTQEKSSFERTFE